MSTSINANQARLLDGLKRRDLGVIAEEIERRLTDCSFGPGRGTVAEVRFLATSGGKGQSIRHLPGLGYQVAPVGEPDAVRTLSDPRSAAVAAARGLLGLKAQALGVQ